MRSTVNRADTAARQAARSISSMRSIASTAASTLSTRNPVTPSSISSRIDPRLQAMTGVPQASASTTDRPNGSSKLIRWSSARADPRVSARALLHLINFDEPFGLSVVEALACGTPVIACNRGSMRELIDDGVTGFLVDGIDAAVAAIGRIGEIDRAACRAAVSARFTVDRMADRYLDLY